MPILVDVIKQHMLQVPYFNTSECHTV